MATDSGELGHLKSHLEQLRNRLAETAEFYSALCSQLRAVESLSSSIVLDYTDIKNATPATLERLRAWRDLERKIFYTLEHHARSGFQVLRPTPQRSRLREDEFLRLLGESGGPEGRAAGSPLAEACSRVKEGLIAVKFTSEARRRVLNLCDFLVRVKGAAESPCSDYWENMAIMSSLCAWVREVIHGASRVTSLSKGDSGGGQSVAANEMIKGVIAFSTANTVPRPAPSDRVPARKLLERTLGRPGLALVDGSVKRLHGSRSYADSQVSYYLFNLIGDLASGNLEAGGLAPLARLKPETPLGIERPLHVYDIHEYYCNFAESADVLERIHLIQKFILAGVSQRSSELVSGALAPVLASARFLGLLGGLDTTEASPSRSLVRSVLVAFRAAHFMASGSGRLVRVWAVPPLPAAPRAAGVRA